MTPLGTVAERVSSEDVAKLLDSGADVHVRDQVSRFFLF